MSSNRVSRSAWSLMTPFALLLSVFAAAGCDKGEAAPGDGGDADVSDGDADGRDDGEAGPDPLQCEPRSTPLALDEAPPEGESVAGRITAAEELIDSEVPMAQVGLSWKIANHEAAFVVQGNETRVGYDMYGGSLLDADLQRGAGEPNHDTFREQFSIVSWKVGGADSVSVLCDGNGGRPAVIRVEGRDEPSLILPPIDALSPRPLNFRIVTDYILEPDTRLLRVRTSSTNEGTRTWSSVAMGDLLLFGSVNLMFGPEVGFGDLAAAGPSMVVTASDPSFPLRHVSYGFASTHGPLSLPIAEGGATGGIGDTVHTLIAGNTAVYERLFTVGRDLSGAMEPLLEGLERPYGVVTGRVTDGAGDPVDRVAVAAFASASDPTAGLAVTEPDGSYRLVVVPGTYDIDAAKVGYLRGSAAAPVTVAAGGSATADLVLGASGTLTLDIRDADGPCPAKVTLYGIDVEALDPRFGLALGERENMGAHRVLMAPPAGGDFAVKPGRYRAVVSRGLEYDFVEQEIDVPDDGAATLTVTLDHLLDTTGWLAGDFHMHTVRSPDGKVTPCERVAEAAAEGLDIAVSTDHDAYTDYLPCIEEQGLSPFMANVRGCEVSNMGAGGHRNAYPLPIAPDWVVQNSGPQYWVGLSAQELNDKLHAESTHPAIQINHGRSTDSYMNWVQFDPIDGTVGRAGQTLVEDWDAMETSNGGDFPFDDVDLFTPANDGLLQEMADSARGDVPLWADYLGFLRLGFHISAMGTSDVHGRNDGTGYARSYVPLGDDPTALTEDQIRDAVIDQRVVVSNGAFLRVVTEGVEAMGSEDVVPIAGTEVELYVEAQALPSFDLSFLYVFANGRPLYLRRDSSGIVAEDDASGGGTPELALLADDALDEVLRLATEVRHSPAADTYYHVMVRGIGSMGPLPSSRPFAYTNAIYVDVDGLP